MPIDPNLFVYGTLLPDDTGSYGAQARARLGREADRVGPASARGRLFDLGDYPGLAEGDGLVHGLVYRLRDPDATLAWLDRYEGVTGRADDEYVRRPRDVELAAGGIISCWTYNCIQFKGGAALIESGRWCLRSTGPAAR